MLAIPVPHELFPLAALIDLDASFLIQLGLFLGTTLILHSLVFRPMLRVELLREERTSGARRNAEEKQEEAQKRITDYESRIRDARRDGNDHFQGIRDGAAHQASSIEATAREKAAAVLDEALPQLEASYQKSRSALEEASQEMSTSILGQILGARSKGAAS